MEVNDINSQYPFLKGSGEMAGLIRRFNWSKTALGSPDHWPQSLRTIVSVMLASRFPMFLWWGPDLIQFYNDAYRPSLGADATHPAALGAKGGETWPEVWPLIKPLIDGIMAGGEAVWGQDQLLPIYRNGQMEDVYWTFSYSPVPGDDDCTAGVLVTCQETTPIVNNLRQSEARFRNLIEEAPVATCLYVGQELRIEVANGLMLRFWGKDRSVIGRPVKEVLPELEAQGFFEQVATVLSTGQKHEVLGGRADVLMEDGSRHTHYFNYSFAPLRHPATGEVYGVINTASDVTDQVKAQQALEESELFARNIIDHSPVAKAVLIGEDMIISIVNQNMLGLLGRDESIIGKPFMEAMPELVPTPVMDRLRYVYATGETHVQPEERIKLIKNGSPGTGYYNYIYKTLRNRDGDIYGIMIAATEVTAQVLSRQKTEAAEARLAAAIELAELGTWSIDLATGHITYSERLQRWLGISEAVLQVQASPRIHPKDRERISRAIGAALRPDGSGRFDETYTITHAVSGQEHIIHASGQTLFDAQGVALSISGTAQDVTLQQEAQLALKNEVQTRTEELAATNEELEETNRQLMRSNEELAQYAYVASHDLQEPLRKIQVFSGLLSDQAALPGTARDTVEKITSSARRMSLLIKDLLEFSRLLKSDALMRPVALGEVLQAVTTDFELTIAEKGAVIEAGPLPVVEAVNLQMNQLFFNLLGNALKFTAPGTAPHISIMAEPISQQEVMQYISKPFPFASYHKLIFTDNGIGFDAQYAEQIFEVFKRLHSRGSYAGSGIGLALCRRIAANHHGTLYARSAPGRGSTFYIILPDRHSEGPFILPQNNPLADIS